MGRKLQDEDPGQTTAIWRVPGLNVLQTRSWASLTFQEVESSGGEGVWRSDRHRISLLLDASEDFTVQFNSGRTRQYTGAGPKLFFCPAGATMRVASGPMRWVQAVEEPTAWLSCTAEFLTHALEPRADFEDPLIVQIMLALADVEGGPADRLMAAALSTALSLRLSNRLGKTIERLPGAARGLSRGQLHRVCEHIEANLDGELTLAGLSAVARLSQWHFSRAFKSAVGIGVHAYVARRRIERAKVLLVQADLSIAEAASAVGFQSAASFTTCFRRLAGITPGGFRRGAS
jgi:AraC family transcriptional regulator